jgi:hypothetical protein
MYAADMSVLGDLTHLRTLPTDFAWVPFQAPYKWWHNKGAQTSLPKRGGLEGVAPLVTSEGTAAVVGLDSRCVDTAERSNSSSRCLATAPQQRCVVPAGGFVFLRPCRAVYDHMVALATNEERLQFSDLHAEQTFISW